MKKDNVILADNLDLQEKHIQIIKDVSMRLAGILNIDQISVLVLEVLVNTLGYKISAVQLIDEEKKNLRFQIINAPKIVLRLVKRFLGFSPSDVKIPLTERKSYLVQSFLEKRITKSNDLYFFNCPVVSARVTKITQKIMRLRDIVAVPLMIKGEPIGVLSVGSSKEISDSELEFFKTFANQIAIALYNAKLLDEQKAQYAELQAAYKKLEELHQLQSLDRAKSEFIRVASHQFRTPLSGIRFEAEYILEKRERGDLAEGEAIDGIILIYERILFLIRTLNDIFDVLEIDQGEAKIKKEETSFAEAVKDAEEIIRQPFVYTQNTKKLTIDIKSVKQPVLIDREKVKRIITVLLTNAFVFTDKNGEILLQAKIKGKGKNRALNILISDNGIGIPAAERAKVFEKFYRASNASRAVPNGTGLGLFIVKTFVQMHGGDIGIKDAKGGGTIFDISLPI
ncbi:MAG: ATP-binding protein [Patescibacteria group bacterium]